VIYTPVRDISTRIPPVLMRSAIKIKGIGENDLNAFR
jgi:hypothetical protein